VVSWKKGHRENGTPHPKIRRKIVPPPAIQTAIESNPTQSNGAHPRDYTHAGTATRGHARHLRAVPTNTPVSWGGPAQSQARETTKTLRDDPDNHLDYDAYIDIFSAIDLEDYHSSDEASKEEKTNKSRLQLLARKYAKGGLTTEEASRLEILTGQIQALIPSVTAEAIDRLSNMTSRLSEINAAISNIQRELDTED
jgi:hypothetical protein